MASNKGEFLYTGDEVSSQTPISNMVSRIVCPDHPDRHWCHINQRDHWGVAYVDLKLPCGKTTHTGDKETLTFRSIEIWLEDPEAGLALSRAMGMR